MSDSSTSRDTPKAPAASNGEATYPIEDEGYELVAISFRPSLQVMNIDQMTATVAGVDCIEPSGDRGMWRQSQPEPVASHQILRPTNADQRQFAAVGGLHKHRAQDIKTDEEPVRSRDQLRFRHPGHPTASALAKSDKVDFERRDVPVTTKAAPTSAILSDLEPRLARAGPLLLFLDNPSDIYSRWRKSKLLLISDLALAPFIATIIVSLWLPMLMTSSLALLGGHSLGQ